MIKDWITPYERINRNAIDWVKVYEEIRPSDESRSWQEVYGSIEMYGADDKTCQAYVNGIAVRMALGNIKKVKDKIGFRSKEKQAEILGKKEWPGEPPDINETAVVDALEKQAFIEAYYICLNFRDRYLEKLLHETGQQSTDEGDSSSDNNKNDVKKGNGKELQEAQRVVGETEKLIQSCFNAMDSGSGYAYAFKSEKTYNNFVSSLTKYYESGGNKENLPTKITLKNRSKTEFLFAMKKIRSELSELDLNKDHGFFDLLSVVTQFENKSQDQLYNQVAKLPSVD